MMDYPCGKFGDRSFSRFGSIVTQRDRQTHTQRDADEGFTPATLVGVIENTLEFSQIFI